MGSLVAVLILAFAVYMLYRNPPNKESISALAANLTPKKEPTSCNEKAGIMDKPADISGNGGFDFSIVGESNYQARIWSMMPDFENDKARAYFIAKLELEDDNEHDNKAVAVSIDRRIVGYLSRADARAYRKWLLISKMKGNLTCRAVVVGSKGKSFGVWLDTPFDNKQ